MAVRQIGAKDVVAELVRTRGLILVLTLRELRARYRGSIFGYLWTLLNPLMLLATYWLVFSVYAKMPIENYAIFLFTGLVPWLWLDSALKAGTTTIVRNHPMVTHGPFPPQILPTVEVCAAMMHCLLSTPVLIAALVFVGMPLSPAIALVPVFVLIQFCFALGFALAASALTVFYRDVQFIIANFVTFWFFLTPGILYKLEMVQEVLPKKCPAPYGEWAAFAFHYGNPMAPTLQCWQAVFYRAEMPAAPDLIGASVHALIFLVGGLVIFARYRYPLVEEI